jgi:hypothetical protein
MEAATMNSIRKKGFNIVLCISMMLLAGTIAGYSQSLGDVNNSGSVDIVDALVIAQYYVGLNPAGFVSSVADVNCSGGIDIVDALVVAQFYVGLITAFPCTATVGPTAIITPAPTIVSGTPAPTSPPGTLNTGNATWFSGIGGSAYGGCGVAQSFLDSQYFIALNVQNTPGDYATMLSRPITAANASKIGMFNNGLNCGRWVHVIISDYCNGVNDGAPNLPFCRGGSGYVPDAYNGAELDLVVADSCQDGNAWCRDDLYHIDICRDALNNFVLNGKAVGDMDPNHWNNRHVNWQFEAAPNYTGDVKIGFIQNAQLYWAVVGFLHLQNGIHGVDYWDGANWVKAVMDSDMGQDYQIGSTSVTNGVPANAFRIRVYDAADQLINNGRIYNFTYPASCNGNCPNSFNEVTYTIE